jgi:hypothetical protein
VFWVDHLCEADDQSLHDRKELSDKGAILTFLREHFLHWLESLGLISKLPIQMEYYRSGSFYVKSRYVIYRVQLHPEY